MTHDHTKLRGTAYEQVHHTKRSGLGGRKNRRDRSTLILRGLCGSRALSHCPICMRGRVGLPGLAIVIFYYGGSLGQMGAEPHRPEPRGAFK